MTEDGRVALVTSVDRLAALVEEDLRLYRRADVYSDTQHLLSNLANEGRSYCSLLLLFIAARADSLIAFLGATCHAISPRG